MENMHKAQIIAVDAFRSFGHPARVTASVRPTFRPLAGSSRVASFLNSLRGARSMVRAEPAGELSSVECHLVDLALRRWVSENQEPATGA